MKKTIITPKYQYTIKDKLLVLIVFPLVVLLTILFIVGKSEWL